MGAVFIVTIVNGHREAEVRVWEFRGKRLALPGRPQVLSPKGQVPDPQSLSR